MEYVFIKNDNDFYGIVAKFKSLLASNTRLDFQDDKIVSIDKATFNYKIQQYKVSNKKEIIYYFTLSSDKNQVKDFENADRCIRRIVNNEKCLKLTTIYDGISMSNSKLLYPKISEIENELRRIIYLFMLKTIGSDWFEKNSPNVVKKDAKNTYQKNHKETDECSEDDNTELQYDSSQDILIYVDFISLVDFLFKPYAINENINGLFKEIRNNGLEEENIDDLSNQYEVKSNWDRYFNKKIKVDGEDFKRKLVTLYRYRNDVAHNKPLHSKELMDADKIIVEVKNDLENGFEEIANMTTNTTQTRAVEEMADNTLFANLPDRESQSIYHASLGEKLLKNSFIDDTNYYCNPVNVGGV